MQKYNGIILIVLLLGVVAAAGCTNNKQTSPNEKVTGSADLGKVTVFKSDTCGCCVGYIAELERQGFEVETVITADLAEIKQQHRIPMDMQSCHTAVIGDYFVEGHVPMEAVVKLLEEKPDIDGIMLPRMPAGSPGMPGTKTGPFLVYSLKDGKATEFMSI